MRNRVVNAFIARNINTVKHLCKLKRFDVKTMDNLGSLSLRVIEYMMKHHDLKFETDYESLPVPVAPVCPQSKKYFVWTGDTMRHISKRELVADLLSELDTRKD